MAIKEIRPGKVLSIVLRTQQMKVIEVITTYDILRPPHLFLTWDMEPER